MGLYEEWLIKAHVTGLIILLMRTVASQTYPDDRCYLSEVAQWPSALKFLTCSMLHARFPASKFLEVSPNVL